MEGYQWGGGGARMGEKIQGLRSISGRYNTDGRLGIVQEVENSKNLHAQPMDMK